MIFFKVKNEIQNKIKKIKKIKKIQKNKINKFFKNKIFNNNKK